MLAKYTAILTVLLSTAAANGLIGRAELVPQLFDRTTHPSGGWSLSLAPHESTGENCPAEAPACGASWCCPADLTCVPTGDQDIGEACCPGNINCISAFTDNPACADDSWVLWNASSNTVNLASYFCCLPDQVGMVNGECVNNDIISSPTQLAEKVGGGSSVTAAPSTSSASSISISTSSTTTVESESTTSTSGSSVTTKVSVTSTTGTGTVEATVKASSDTENPTATTGRGSNAGGTATTTSSGATSSSGAASANSNSGDKNAVRAGLLGLVGAAGFAVGIL